MFVKAERALHYELFPSITQSINHHEGGHRYTSPQQVLPLIMGRGLDETGKDKRYWQEAADQKGYENEGPVGG